MSRFPIAFSTTQKARISAAFGMIFALACTACTPHVITRTETVEVPVTHIERAVKAEDVAALQPPPPLGPRPASAAAAADTLAAKLCEYVWFAAPLDLMVQHAAGLTPKPRVAEPLCDAAPR